MLQQTLKLAQRAVSVRNDDADLIVELGSQLLMAGKTQEAARCFQNAMKVDESNVLALTGIIRCQLLEDRIEEASQQLEFMNELKQTLGRSAVSDGPLPVFDVSDAMFSGSGWDGCFV